MDLNAHDAPLCLSVHTPNAAITTYSDTLLGSRNDCYHFLRLDYMAPRTAHPELQK